MIALFDLLDLQIVIFLSISIGYFLTKKNIFTIDTKKALTNLVIYIVLPANIITSFFIDMNTKLLQDTFLILCISFSIQIICLVSSNYIYRRFDRDTFNVLKYATICSNAGFLGSPVVYGIYGAQGLLLASIYLIPVRIFMWSSGIACFTKATSKEVLYKVITHPCIIAVMIGFLLMLTNIQLPSFMNATLYTVGDCTTFLSMLVIGCILSEVDFKSVIDKLNIYYCILRLLILPSVVLCICILCNVDPLVSAVSCVLTGMPAGSTTAILASKYNSNETLAVKIVFLSTLLSLLTIPLFTIGISLLY